MIFFVNPQLVHKISKRIFERELAFENIVNNYVFVFLKLNLTLVYPKNVNIIFNIKNSFYLNFPPEVFETVPERTNFELMPIEIINDKLVRYKKNVLIYIPEVVPAGFRDFANIVYEHTISNFWNDLIILRGGYAKIVK